MIVAVMSSSFLRRSSVGSCARHRDAHEAEARGAVELARIEEDGRDVHLALQLLEQRQGSIDGEERPGPHDEHDVAKRVGVAGDPLCNQVVERLVFTEHFVDRLDRRRQPD